MSTHSIVVIGDIILDEYWYGVSERISPEAPVPVVLKKQSASRLGGAANVALNIKTLGEESYLIGYLGEDEAGQKVQGLLKEHKISSGVLTGSQWTTIQKLRILANNHYIGRVDFEEPFAMNPDELMSKLPQDAKGVQVSDSAKWCVLSDYGKGTVSLEPQKISAEQTQSLIQKLNDRGYKVLVDPKASFDHYQGAWLIKPNKKEFETYVGGFADRQELIEKAQASLKQFQFQYMLITLGPEGMVLVGQSEEPQWWPAQALDVFDVTGAGDTVIATLTSFLAKGMSLSDSIAKSSRAAAIAVSKKGVYNVKLEEL